MNQREAKTKFGKLDDELNRISKFLFTFMLINALLIVGLN